MTVCTRSSGGWGKYNKSSISIFCKFVTVKVENKTSSNHNLVGSVAKLDENGGT